MACPGLPEATKERCTTSSASTLSTVRPCPLARSSVHFIAWASSRSVQVLNSSCFATFRSTLAVAVLLSSFGSTSTSSVSSSTLSSQFGNWGQICLLRDSSRITTSFFCANRPPPASKSARPFKSKSAPSTISTPPSKLDLANLIVCQIIKSLSPVSSLITLLSIAQTSNMVIDRLQVHL